ncbi:hypothetical protein [Mycoplasmopsis columboralis]|uniref:Uncharacterized protein n=1 Tax=Mycoplasmopsis columboralis TaxID=171282 RepID=A0A449B6Y4_9BACT|nr:hypothetical protein [Mycoplasmopsis columboralis]VEU76339.1 Uncharacterised protein [Mycoplasmopsis columboralis]
MKAKKTKKQKIWITLFIVLTILFLVAIAVCCAYIGDFLVYRNTEMDGKLLTYAQRMHGVFGFW